MQLTYFRIVQKPNSIFRQLSGAMIRISNCEDRDANVGGSNINMDRTITITGNAESVALAQYLINMRYASKVYQLLIETSAAFACRERRPQSKL